MGWILFALLIGVPLIEIYLFVEIGGAIGAWPTVGLVVLTAAAGTIMLRAQGRRVLARAQEKMRRGEPPVADLLHGIGLLAAGALLLTPGFLTDGVGFALLLPAARQWLAARLWTAIQARGTVHAAGFGAGRGFGPEGGFGRDTVIDGEFETVEPEGGPPEATPDAAPDSTGGAPRIGGPKAGGSTVGGGQGRS